jgi:hypothetical protein
MVINWLFYNLLSNQKIDIDITNCEMPKNFTKKKPTQWLLKKSNNWPALVTKGLSGLLIP